MTSNPIYLHRVVIIDVFGPADLRLMISCERCLKAYECGGAEKVSSGMGIVCKSVHG